MTSLFKPDSTKVNKTKFFVLSSSLKFIFKIWNLYFYVGCKSQQNQIVNFKWNKWTFFKFVIMNDVNEMNAD